MPVSHQPKDLAALGRQWVEAWNSRDLERVLTLYAKDAEMTSDRIPALGFDASGTVRGKASLRDDAKSLRHSGMRRKAQARNPYPPAVVMDSGLDAPRRPGMTVIIVASI